MKHTLDPVWIETADEVGRRRRQAAIDGKRVNKAVRASSPEELLWLDIWSARAECAVWRAFYPCHWYMLAEDLNNLPDIDDFIDVKGVLKPTDRLIIPDYRKDKPEWAYLLVDCSAHPDYELVGWMWGDHAMIDEFRDKALPKEGWAIRRDHKAMSKPEELLTELRIRQDEGRAARA